MIRPAVLAPQVPKPAADGHQPVSDALPCTALRPAVPQCTSTPDTTPSCRGVSAGQLRKAVARLNPLEPAPGPEPAQTPSSDLAELKRVLATAEAAQERYSEYSQEQVGRPWQEGMAWWHGMLAWEHGAHTHAPLPQPHACPVPLPQAH